MWGWCSRTYISLPENIAYGRPGASREEIVEAARQAGAHEFIQKLPGGYDADIGPHGVRLSGGQQQRLSIARVFLKDPPILIFDEATNALDSGSERKAGRILVLDGNGICEQGTHQELMDLDGVYAGLYQASCVF